jgi:uncharacterized membrane protein YeaQ/YmgE (transglycosylase-associated protein family)
MWTATNLLIHIVTGIVGGHAAAAAAKEHSFGLLGHTVTGALGGALSGYFLQAMAISMVLPSGDSMAPTVAENAALQGLTGLGAGACLTLIVGLLKHSLDQHRSQKPQPPQDPQ